MSADERFAARMRLAESIADLAQAELTALQSIMKLSEQRRALEARLTLLVLEQASSGRQEG